MSPVRLCCVWCAFHVRCAQTYHRGCGQHWREDKVWPGSNDLDVKLVRVNHLDLRSFSEMSVRFGMINDGRKSASQNKNQIRNVSNAPPQRYSHSPGHERPNPSRAPRFSSSSTLCLAPCEFSAARVPGGSTSRAKRGSCHHTHKRGRAKRIAKTSAIGRSAAYSSLEWMSGMHQDVLHHSLTRLPRRGVSEHRAKLLLV
jgi:hypothetical protein